MNLIKEISESLGLDEFAPTPFFFSVSGKGGGYFQNIKKIADVKPDKIILETGKGEITISGKSLAISRFSGGDVVIKGQISSIEVNA